MIIHSLSKLKTLFGYQLSFHFNLLKVKVAILITIKGVLCCKSEKTNTMKNLALSTSFTYRQKVTQGKKMQIYKNSRTGLNSADNMEYSKSQKNFISFKVTSVESLIREENFPKLLNWYLTFQYLLHIHQLNRQKKHIWNFR